MSAEFRGTNRYVAWGAAGRGRLFFHQQIGDPAAYLLPDVTCDWRYVDITQVGEDRVEVGGARGNPPPPTLKVCAQVVDGYKVLGLIFIAGRDATRKAKRFGNDFIRRAERRLQREGFAPLRGVDIEILGAESTYGPHSQAQDAREVVVKIGLHHDSRAVLEAIVRELGSFGMAVPGLTAGGRGLPKPTPLVRLKCYLVPRDLVRPRIHLDGSGREYEEPRPQPRSGMPPERSASAVVVDDLVELPLITIAHARSGDKGADANIGVRARHPDFFPLLRAQLTARRVAQWLAHRIEGPVRPYEVPSIHALNFVLQDALGGGGHFVAALRSAGQGLRATAPRHANPNPRALAQPPRFDGNARSRAGARRAHESDLTRRHGKPKPSACELPLPKRCATPRSTFVSASR